MERLNPFTALILTVMSLSSWFYCLRKNGGNTSPPLLSCRWIGRKNCVEKMKTEIMSKERLEAFSDGVFAVALTLLILELHAPDVARHSSLSEYATAIAPLIPKVVSFVLTFVIIC